MLPRFTSNYVAWLAMNSPSLCVSFQTVDIVVMHHHVELLNQGRNSCSPFTPEYGIQWHPNSFTLNNMLTLFLPGFMPFSLSTNLSRPKLQFLVLALFLFGARQFLLLLGISCLYYSGASQTSPCQMLQYYLHCKCLRFSSFLKKHFNHTRFVIISQITMLICESVIYQHGCFPLLYASCI